MVRHFFGSRDRRNDVSCSCSCTRKFTYDFLRNATNNFSKDRIIGKGGSARIYKGVLPNGQVVAVKKYKESKLSEWETDFMQIVEVMSSQIRHKNIHQIIGYCMEANHRLLVSEYMENGSLYDLLEDSERRGSIFDWHMRVAVCIGIARGISYLHEDINPRVVHRDIKPGNILLDSNLTAKITDFDLAGLFYDTNDLPCEADVAGTAGYLDPEYFMTSTYSEKVDVYGFGVSMLEIISGRKAIDRSIDFDNDDDRHIISWVARLKGSNRVLEMVDPVLTEFPEGDVRRFIDVALLCTQSEGRLRPSMHEVVLKLQGMCNCCRRAFRMFDMPTRDYQRNFPAGATNENFLELISSNPYGDSNSEVQAQGEQEQADNSAQSEEVETSTTREQRDEDQIETVLEVLAQQQHMGIILSGSGNLVERLSQTTVFKKSTKLDFPEAVYPPFRTRVFRRGGSRNLYTF